MVLHTKLVDDGLRLATTASITDAPVWHTFPVPSETFLEVIEHAVIERGGWQTVTDWVTSTSGNSFTSLRGLVALINTLIPLHGLTAWSRTSDESAPERAALPLAPRYHMEPHISKSSTGVRVLKK